MRRQLKNNSADTLHQLAELGQKAEAALSSETLLGIEGMAAKAHFAVFADLLKGDQAFNIDGRNRRPPRDPTNALLSFVYAMLVKEVTVAVRAVGFDPALGFFHRPRYGRPSLALGLAVEFRPLVADSTALILVDNGEVAPESFIRRAGGVALTKLVETNWVSTGEKAAALTGPTGRPGRSVGVLPGGRSRGGRPPFDEAVLRRLRDCFCFAPPC